ncbi:MAG: zf-HC2 domain-containing protein [Treponema sp.]|nr:zf-HC2 domain-containing protein [Candidatus Treponema equi]
MSICPESDLHSVYLDGELPEEFVAEYEAHVSSCPKCSAELEKLTKLHGFFQEDSKSIAFTQEQLDASFERLQAKMSYSRFKKEEAKHVVKFPRFKGVQFFVAGIAAAAAVAFVIPRNVSKIETVRETFAPVARTSMSGMFNRARIDSNLDATQLASFLGSEEVPGTLVSVSAMSDQSLVQKMILDDSYGKSSFSSVKPALADYDVFCPVEEIQEEAEHSRGFTFSVSSPIIKVSFQVGK